MKPGLAKSGPSKSGRAPWAVLVAATAVVFAAAAPALANDVNVTHRLGHGGRFVKGAATPLAVTLENTTSEGVTTDVAVEFGRRDGNPLIRYSRTVFVGPGAARREVFLVPGPDFGDPIRIEYRTSPRTPVRHGRDVATRGIYTADVDTGGPNVGGLGVAAVSYEAKVIGVVNDPRGILAARLPLATEADVTGADLHYGVVAVLDVNPADLKFAPFSLDGFDTLVLADPDSTTCAAPGVADAVLDWVALGGRLVVSLGERAADFTASPLAPHMPALWTSADRRNYRVPLTRTFGVDVSRLGLGPGSNGPWVGLQRKDMPRTSYVETPGGDVHRASRQFGRGTIVLLPVDVRRAVSMVGDPDEMPAVARVLVPDRVPRVKGERAVAMMYEFIQQRLEIGTSLSVLLRQNAFEPPPFLLVLLGLILYVAVVGPLDWVILKRFKKQRLTTFTFAGSVAAFTAVAYAASLLVFASDAVVNRVQFVDLVDGEREGRELVRAVDVAGFYAPGGADQDLEYTLAHWIAPTALPGGAEAGQSGTTLTVDVVGTDPVRSHATVEIAVLSQRTVRTVVAGPTGRTLDVTRVAPDGRNGFELFNGLPVDLRAAFLVVRGRVWEFGGVPSGETASATPGGDVPGIRWVSHARQLDKDETSPDDVFPWLAFLSSARDLCDTDDTSVFRRLGPSEMVTFMKAGFDRSGSFPGPDHGGGHGGGPVLIAYADHSPFPVPGRNADGRTYTIIRKELNLR